MQISDKLNISKGLFSDYGKYFEKSITTRRFKHKQIASLLALFSENSKISLGVAGHSILGREIFTVKIGKGKKKVLLWSQMHGNEPTATAAIMDIFNFFIADDQFNKVREALLDELTLYFVPMLNPDGAERFIRYNAIGIDINRDAIEAISPEARVLKTLHANIQPDFAFNLHDQDVHYRAGLTENPAIISFLSPSYDVAKNVNTPRTNALKVISSMINGLNPFAQGCIAKYNDDFNPKCFGDYFQRTGTSTILIESGGHYGDIDRKFARKLNFVGILMGLLSIADISYEKENIETYNQLPFNDKNYFDLIIRNIYVVKNGKRFPVQIAINRTEFNIEDKFNNRYFHGSTIEQIGDLKGLGAYEDIDGEDMTAIPGKVFPEIYRDINRLKDLDAGIILGFMELGFTTLRLKRLPWGRDFSSLPINLIQSSESIRNTIRIGDNPNFILTRKGKVMAAVVNGYYYELNEIRKNLKNL